MRLRSFLTILYQKSLPGIWYFALVMLPFTSLPLLAQWLRIGMVAPPSAALFALLGLV
jgi:hypothetical protein